MRAVLHLEPNSSNWSNNEYMYSWYCPHRRIIISLLQLFRCIKYTNNYAIGYYTYDTIVTIGRVWHNAGKWRKKQLFPKLSLTLGGMWLYGWAVSKYCTSLWSICTVLSCRCFWYAHSMFSTHINLYIIHDNNWTVQYKYYFHIYNIIL